MIRFCAACILLFLSTLLSPWLLLPFAILHAFSWFAFELIIIAAAIDAYFGVLYVAPYYTISALGLVVLAEWVKPRLSVYADE